MLNDKENYQKEENQVLKMILNQRFFDPWSYDFCDEYSLWNVANLELYLTNACNQHCEYCYLIKYPELYPKEYTNPQLILKNLKLVYDWILEHDYRIPKIEFFTGEIWHTEFGWQVLDLTLEYLHQGMKIEYFLIASNFSFIFTDKARSKISSYIQRFKELDRPLIFSCSCDGAVIEELNRPTNNKIKRDDHYWDILFDFCSSHSCFFHPMLSAKSVKYWKENWQWWKQQCLKWNMIPHRAVNILEVRNNDWTDENIQDFCDFLEYLIQDFLQDCNYDIKKYTRYVLHMRTALEKTEEKLIDSGYSLLNLPMADTFPGCTVSTDLTIRVGDLAICPCHRTAYNKYLLGHFITENDKITDIQANNVPMAIKTLMANQLMTSHGCDNCLFNTCCIHGCLGSQIESTGDPFFPVESVCKMLKTKYAYLLKRYEELGIIDYLKTITPYEEDYVLAEHILKIYYHWVEEGKPYVMAANK